MKLSKSQYLALIMASAAALGYVVDHAAELGLSEHATAAIAMLTVFVKAYLNPPSTPQE